MLKKKIKIYNYNKSGSVLVFTLFVMVISLIIGIGLISSVTTTRKSTLSTAKSVNSFQVADSGIEYAFDLINKYVKDTSNVLDPVGGVKMNSVFDISGECQSPEGTILKTMGTTGSCVISFYDDHGHQLDCNNASGRVGEIKTIKSVGTYHGISRYVESTGVDLLDIFPL